ncbi:MAG TPA: glycosyltransferase, partial [Armatimonadetes bacterium]|nr:glycosyltransferase [Armatimonadota bacterium]
MREARIILSLSSLKRPALLASPTATSMSSLVGPSALLPAIALETFEFDDVLWSHVLFDGAVAYKN